MKNEFFEMYSSQTGLSLEIGHNSVADWIIIVRDKKSVDNGEQDVEVCFVEHCDIDYVFAHAYIALADYLSNERGGY